MAINCYSCGINSAPNRVYTTATITGHTMLSLDTHVISTPHKNNSNTPEWSGTVAQLIDCAPNLVKGYVARKTGEAIIDPKRLATTLNEDDLAVILGDSKVSIAQPL